MKVLLVDAMENMDIVATPVRLKMLSPHHYQSLAIPSGVSSLSTHLADRSVVYGLSGAFGSLNPSVALPWKDYRRDFSSALWFASVFETITPRLMRPQGRRLNLDQEGGFQKSIQTAIGTGNLKSWFFIQEIPPYVDYHGAVFGPDPFKMASEIEQKEVLHIIFRMGRHRGGIVRMQRSEVTDVRLNLHTGFICGADFDNDRRLKVEIPALWDLQISKALPLSVASEIVKEWRFMVS
ncbi:MAG: hypothetical protein OXF20_06900 [Gammaproteobacteria bacterium]|nr:hypothetical protein [Gammaproteobacteria bacterium]